MPVPKIPAARLAHETTDADLVKFVDPFTRQFYAPGGLRFINKTFGKKQKKNPQQEGEALPPRKWKKDPLGKWWGPVQKVSPEAKSVVKSHIAAWKDCDNCELCKGRTQVVHYRGILPCDVLFIGEAPGQAEDALGEPFIGPSGKVLETIIDEVIDETFDFKYALTNVVACRPVGVGGENRTPKAVEIKACALKLYDMIDIAKAYLIVRVGNTAQKYVHVDGRTVDIKHPSWMLQTENTELEMKRARLAIVQAMNRIWDI